MIGIMKDDQYKQLFQVAGKFHSFMDKDAILAEIIVTLQEVYPTFSYYLLLSQDNDVLGELPIMDLEYDSENIAAINAYVSGDIQFEESASPKRCVLYTPLKGKQGVYGVLQVIAHNKLVFPEDDVEFIDFLAKTAGSAIENAQLYQQSRQVISDLQLINETSHRLNSNLRLTEIVTYLTNQIKNSFGAQEVGLILLVPNGETKVLPGSTPYFFSKQAHVYIDYIKEKIQTKKISLFICDLNLPQINDQDLFPSIMAVPMIHNENLNGFYLVMHQNPYFFSFESFKLLQALIHHSSLALHNSMLREELERTVVIDHLTNLHSRNYLDEKTQSSMKEDEEGTFILFDIDNFKEINDTYGHQVGDEVLIQVADLIKESIRENDIGARWGGEELAIYLPKVTLETGRIIAERIVGKVAECSNPHITVSCGVSYWKKDSLDTYNYLFKRADEALYIAKGTGKNKVVPQKDIYGKVRH